MIKFEEKTNKGYFREYTLRVTAEELNCRVEDEVANWVETRNFPGFRKGKIPVNIILSRNGEEIKNIALKKIIETALKQHSEEINDNPITEKPELISLPADDDEYKYSLSYEVYPDIPEIEFDKNIVIQRPVIENLEEVINITQNNRIANLNEYMMTDHDYVSCEDDIIECRLLTEDMDKDDHSEGLYFNIKAKSDHEFASHFIGVSRNDVLRFNCEVAEEKTISFNILSYKSEFNDQKENKTSTLNYEKNVESTDESDAVDIFIIITEVRKSIPVEFDAVYAENQGYQDCDDLMTTEKKKLEDKFNLISDFIASLRLVSYIDSKLDFELPEKFFELELENALSDPYSKPDLFKYHHMISEDKFNSKIEFLNSIECLQSTSGPATKLNNESYNSVKDFLEEKYLTSLDKGSKSIDSDDENTLRDDLKIVLRRDLAFSQYCKKKDIKKEIQDMDLINWIKENYMNALQRSIAFELVSENERFINFVLISLNNEHTLSFINNLVSIENVNISYQEYVDLLKNI